MYEDVVGYTKGSGQMYPMHQSGDFIACECKGYTFRSHCRHLDMFRKGDYYLKVRYKIQFDNGYQQWEIPGEEAFEHASMTPEEIVRKVKETEAHLSKLLNMKVEIQQIDV